MQHIENILTSIRKSSACCGEIFLKPVQDNSVQISEVLDMLSDDDSKDIYMREIVYSILVNFLQGDLPALLAGLMEPEKWRTMVRNVFNSDIFSFIECPPNGEECLARCIASTFLLNPYLYKDKFAFEDQICLDIGACFGDTTIDFIERGAAQVYAFEPDKNNIACMKKTFAKLKGYRNISIVPLGVSDTNSTLFFQPSQGNPAAGHIDSQINAEMSGYYEVACTTLDDWCAKNSVKPTFIKMDIEGAEPAAIRGGETIFRECRPILAISIYHSWKQKFEIPLQLKAICKDYNFYIKKARPDYDVVLFGIPQEVEKKG